MPIRRNYRRPRPCGARAPPGPCPDPNQSHPNCRVSPPQPMAAVALLLFPALETVASIHTCSRSSFLHLAAVQHVRTSEANCRNRDPAVLRNPACRVQVAGSPGAIVRSSNHPDDSRERISISICSRSERSSETILFTSISAPPSPWLPREDNTLFDHWLFKIEHLESWRTSTRRARRAFPQTPSKGTGWPPCRDGSAWARRSKDWHRSRAAGSCRCVAPQGKIRARRHSPRHRWRRPRCCRPRRRGFRPTRPACR